MDLEYYDSFFHDGSILNVKHEDDHIVILMNSVEMFEEDCIDEVVLAQQPFPVLRGNLHLEGVKSFKENGEEGTFRMKSEEADIFHFDYSEKVVKLSFKWISYPPNPPIHENEAYSEVIIEAEKIWWENLPEMIIPY